MRNKASFVVFVGGIVLALSAPGSVSLETAPDVLIQSVTGEVIAAIRSGDARDPSNIARLAEARIVPHFDFARMTRLAMGRNWRLASPGQQQALIAAFKTLLVRTYSASLALYRDQAIEFEPLRAAPGDTEVTVRSVVKRPSTPAVHIDYAMEHGPAEWKVYDVNVDGMSLVITYRGTVASQLREQGVAGLIKALAAKNRSNDLPSNRTGAQANAS